MSNPAVHVFNMCSNSDAKKLTITIDEQVYQGLYRVAGPGKISQFIEKLIRTHVLESNLDAAYAQMAQDEEREDEAFQWSEGLIGSVVAIERATKTKLH